MGYYVNPPNETKEAWLAVNGKPAASPRVFDKASDDAFVVLVDNGMFTAAGVAFCADELEVFSHPDDRRPKTWYSVPKAKLEEVGAIRLRDFR